MSKTMSELKQIITENASEFHLDPGPDLDTLTDSIQTPHGFACRGGEAFIEYLYVYPEWRGRGVVAELLDAAREKWGQEMLLSLRCHPDLVEMYEHLGFRLTGEAGSAWDNFVEMIEVGE